MTPSTEMNMVLVAEYLDLAICSIRTGHFWYGGDWHRVAKTHAQAMEGEPRRRALELCDVITQLALKAEYARSRARIKKRGRCLLCGDGPIVLFKVTDAWACAACASEIEDDHG